MMGRWGVLRAPVRALSWLVVGGVLVAAGTERSWAQEGPEGAVAAGGVDGVVAPREPIEELWEEFTLPDSEVGRAVRQGMPLTADQLAKILSLVAAQREAVARAARPPPTLRAREVAVSLDAAEEAPVVAIQMGYTSGVSFIDATGEPWPVARLIVEESFGPVADTEGSGEEGSPGHSVYVTPKQRFLHGNAVVELASLASPVVLELKAGKGIVDSRLTVRLRRPGPNADPMVVERTDDFGPGDPLISSLLHGHAPEGAKGVAIRGGGPGDRAWRIDGALFLRTAKTLLAPQPQAFERGANGDVVYRLVDTPYAVVSLEGSRVRLEFGGEVPSGG